MRLAEFASRRLFVAAIVLAATSIGSSHETRADEPRLAFDFGRTLECRDVTPPDFGEAYPDERIVECTLRLSVSLADGSMDEEEKKELIATNVERGWKAFQTGNHDEALARMKRLASADPEHPLPPYLTARVKERTGDYAEALEIATQANAKRPDDRPTWVVTGTDAAGVESAARAFEEGTLEHRFALAVSDDLPVALPAGG